MGKALLKNLLFIFFISQMICPLIFFHVAPVYAPLYGVTQLKFALGFTGIIASILSLFTVHKFAYAKMATGKYETLLEEGALEDEALEAYELGKQAKDWLPYLESFNVLDKKKRVTYEYPLLFRAGIESEVNNNGFKPS